MDEQHDTQHAAPHEVPPDPAQAQEGPPPGDEQRARQEAPAGEQPGVDWQRVRQVHRLQRPHDRVVAGVCAGLGQQLRVDPLVLRVAFGVLAFFGGAGLLLYAAFWMLLPDEGEEHAPIQLDDRSRAVALTVVAAVAALALVGDSWGLFGAPWPLAVLTVVGVVWYFSRPDSAGAAAPGTPRDPFPPAGPTAAGGPDSPGGPAQYAWQPHPTIPHAQAYQPVATAYAGAPGSPQPTAPLPLPPRPRDPRRRGPVLFWFTLALVALALGVLGTVELAGVAVANSAYPALALAICAVMLLVGAFWGRAGGITALALVAAFATAGAMTPEHWGGSSQVAAPTSVTEVDSSYRLDRGELTLDLTSVQELDELDGRSIALDLGAGRLRLIVPRGLGVDVVAEVGGPGAISLPGHGEQGGIAIRSDASLGPSDAPRIEVRAELGVGQIQVVRR